LDHRGKVVGFPDHLVLGGFLAHLVLGGFLAHLDVVYLARLDHLAHVGQRVRVAKRLKILIPKWCGKL
jgi:hypothetical protein